MPCAGRRLAGARGMSMLLSLSLSFSPFALCRVECHALYPTPANAVAATAAAVVPQLNSAVPLYPPYSPQSPPSWPLSILLNAHRHVNHNCKWW